MGQNTVTVTTDNWESEVVNSQIPVIVDLWAEWCGPCKQVAPVLEEFAAEYAGRIKVAKVNVDEQPQIASAFDVQSIPTLGVVYQGGLVGKVIGFGGRGNVKQLFEEVEKIPAKIKELEAAKGTGPTPPTDGA